MTELPVREMVLYKHGVGFFVREGAARGEHASLTFRQDEINDVLKSLAIFDRSGGQVLGIHYQTPMDRAARLANSSIQLADDASLNDLLRDLRGRRATLSFETTPGTVENLTGRIIGVDKVNLDTSQQMALPQLIESLVFLSDHGQVRVFPLNALRAFHILDPQSEYDLSYFLDTSMSEDNRRVVNVRLSSGDHQLVVYYVAPSPTWRVSYRLVASSDEGGETGRALLQGWGLFDNRLEEDLENVRVTLVAGQPISFIYDLYESRIPQRPMVRDESRVAPGPIEFAGIDLADDDALYDEERARGITSSKMRLAEPQFLMAAKSGAAMRREDIAQSTPAAAQTKEAGEFFQYIVTAPVSVKRGESALVPIIGSEVVYQRELLYNGAKLPNHPVAALRFKNTSGLTLERGPVTVVEDGDYKGEAVVPFTKEDNEVYVPYAVELGVRVGEESKQSNQTVGLHFREAFIIYDEYHIWQNLYKLENTTGRALKVTIEAPINPGFELFETPPPAVETASERRWQVEVPARGKIQFLRKERRLLRREEALQKLNYKQLQRFMENRWLDDATFSRLSDMLDNQARIQEAEARKKQLAAERDTVYGQQEQLRKNLGALQATGQEAALRSRMLAQLESTQDHLDEIDRRLNEADVEIEAAQQAIVQILSALGQAQ